MTMAAPTTTARRKAVWGPKRTLVALVVVALASPLSAFAAPNPKTNTNKIYRVAPPSRHRTQVPKLQPGHAGALAIASDTKLDKVLTVKKVASSNSKELVSAIVTLTAGQDLPAVYKKYARRYFSIIGAYEIDNMPVTLL